MKIFLSYSSNDKLVAEEVQLALSGAGHKVFFDRRSLPPAGDFHTRIRDAVQQSEIFVFLISPDAVKSGCYTLTELKFAERKWPSPKGKVLPVMAHPTPWDAIPAYLKAVTVLEPKGNLAAETADAIEMLKDGLPEEHSTSPEGVGLHEADLQTQVEEDLQREQIPAAVVALLKGSVALGKWETEIIRHGKHGHTYKESFDGVEYLATPSAEYSDDQDHRCRTLRTSKRDHGRWVDIPPITFVWNEGDWFPLLKREALGRAKQPGTRERRLQAVEQVLRRTHNPRPPDTLATTDQRSDDSVKPADAFGADGVLQLDDDEPFVTCAYCKARVKARNLDLHNKKVHSDG